MATECWLCESWSVAKSRRQDQGTPNPLPPQKCTLAHPWEGRQGLITSSQLHKRLLGDVGSKISMVGTPPPLTLQEPANAYSHPSHLQSSLILRLILGNVPLTTIKERLFAFTGGDFWRGKHMSFKSFEVPHGFGQGCGHIRVECRYAQWEQWSRNQAVAPTSGPGLH